MYRPIRAWSEEHLERFCALPGLAPLTPDTLSQHRPDASWMLADDADGIVARCSLWWTAGPELPGHRVGLIGHYAGAGPVEAGALLDLACAELAAEGCSLAVAPMDGSTWRRYRLLTERGGEPAFFLEPDNPDDWPRHFAASGFVALARYVSNVNADLGRPDARIPSLSRRLSDRGIRIRSVRPDRLAEELHSIYTLATVAFRENFLYTPITEKEFMVQYQALLPHVQPELVLIAEREDRSIGFLFAIPDLLQARRGRQLDTIILKTMTVHPAHAGAGLGTLLMGRCHDMAHRLGYRRAVHALMHEANPSLSISRHSAQPIRRYTLFARPLGETP